MSEGQVVSEIYVTPADVSSAVHSMSESKTVSLPGELTDFIIDHLHDDSKALRSCAIVCRSWTVRAYSHLWSLLRLCDGLDYPGLIEGIHGSPNIVHHVRKIETHGAFSEFAHRVLNSLGIFSNLEALTISAMAPPEGDWIPRTISATLTSLVLRDVLFQDADDMHLFIRGFTNLCNLSIEDTVYFPCRRLLPPAECRILHLRRLKLAPIRSLSERMCHWLQGLNVEIHVDFVRIGWLSSDLGLLPRKDVRTISLRVMGPSLKHLEIEIAPGPIREGATGMLEDIDMSHAVNLLTVTLEINAIYPVATISRLIESTISRVPLSLQTFIFKVGCYHAYTPDDRPRGGVELLSRLDCDLLARAFAGFHGVVTIRLMYPAVWDTADSTTLKTLSRAAHLRLEYVTEAGDVLLYAELPPQNLKGGGMIYKI